MTWFKVDDGLPAHEKIEALEELGDVVHAQAVALWTLAGADSAHRLSDGHVTMRRLRKLVPWDPESAAEALVCVGLWVKPEDGYSYHDWADHQPMREEVLAKREAASRRQKRHRAKQIARDDTGRFSTEEPATDPSRVSHAVTDGDVTRDVTRESRRESPATRPDPARPVEVNNNTRARTHEPRAEHWSDTHRQAVLGYRDRYEQATAVPWMQWAAHDQDFSRLAQWVDAVCEAEQGRVLPIAVLDAVLDGFFRDEWARAHDFPPRKLAKTPQMYARRQAA